MGAGIVILFWGIVAAVFGVIWVCLLGAFITSFLLKKRWLKWVAGIPFCLLSLLVITALSLLAYGLIQSTRPSVVFKQAFGRPPPAGVSNVKSKYWFFADSGSIYLRFNYSHQTLATLKPGTLEKVSADKFFATLGNRAVEDPPKWWIPPRNPGADYYVRATDFGNGKEFATEVEISAYDPRSGTVYYNYLGID